MKYTIVLLQFLLLTVAAPVFSKQLHAQSVRRNFIGGELLGRGLLYSFNYERLWTDRIGTGGGIAVLRVSEAGLFSASHRSTSVVIPAYLSWTPVGRTHRPYLAAGVTSVASKRNESLLGNIRYDSFAVGTLTAGYQFRSGGGFLFRPTINHILTNDGNGWWPGITLGISF